MSKKYSIFLTVLFCAVHRRDIGGQPPACPNRNSPLWKTAIWQSPPS